MQQKLSYIEIRILVVYRVIPYKTNTSWHIIAMAYGRYLNAIQIQWVELSELRHQASHR